METTAICTFAIDFESRWNETQQKTRPCKCRLLQVSFHIFAKIVIIFLTDAIMTALFTESEKSSRLH